MSAEAASIELPGVVSNLEAATATTGAALVEAGHAHAMAIRSALLSLEHDRVDEMR